VPAGEGGKEEESDEGEDDGNDAARIVSCMFRGEINKRILTGGRGILRRS
jgi:hypothetical protein